MKWYCFNFHLEENVETLRLELGDEKLNKLSRKLFIYFEKIAGMRVGKWRETKNKLKKYWKEELFNVFQS